MDRAIHTKTIYKSGEYFIEPINIDHISSSEVFISYNHSKGPKIQCFSGSEEEFFDIFEPTNLPILPKHYKSKPLPKLKYLPPPNKDKSNARYNLVYYIGKKKIETYRYNMTIGYAKILKNRIKDDPKYRMGRFEIEPNV
jgi:hypothetical protein